MQQPTHVLTFTVTYPQFRDYYFYTIRDQKKGRLSPKLFLLAAVAIGGISSLVQQSLPEKKIQGFLGAFSLLTALAVLGSFLYRFCLYCRVRKKARRLYRLDRIGKDVCQLALYEGYFTIHYPTFAFDGLYSEIESMDRTEKMTIFCLQCGAMVPIPNTALSGEITRKMGGTAGNAVLKDPKESGFLSK